MDLYIFGAGASVAEGAPSTKQFLAFASKWLSAQDDPRVAVVWRFIARVFGRPVTGPGSFGSLPAIDELISLIDWSLSVNQGLGPAYDPPRLYRVRRAIEHVLCATLDAALADRRGAPDGPHARFVRGLVARPPEEYALLSLNYDTLLDDALTAVGLGVEYGLGTDGSPAPEGSQAPFLGKLHGSLNWAQCPACGYITTATRKDGLLLPQMEALRCVGCGNARLDGLIISPTWLKRYHASRLQAVWDRALVLLSQADRLLFVGYSMPPADVAIHQLIRRGLLLGKRREPPAVEVINAEVGGDECRSTMHRESVRTRFEALFGEAVRFDFSGFHGQLEAGHEKSETNA